MKIDVLGSGTSTGVPVLGCSCSVCKSKSIFNMRTRSSIAVTTEEGTCVVIDTAPEFRLQAVKAGINRVDSVLYTHLHADHCAGFDDLRAFSFTNDVPVECYLAKEFIGEFKSRFSYVFNETGYIGAKPKIELKEITSSCFTVQGIQVEVLRLPHGHVQSTAFKIGRFLYATDFKAFSPEQIRQLVGKIDLMIASGIHFGEHAAHSTIPETLDLFSRLDIKQGIITHLSHDVDYLRDSAMLPAHVGFAFDGMTLNLSE